MVVGGRGEGGGGGLRRDGRLALLSFSCFGARLFLLRAKGGGDRTGCWRLGVPSRPVAGGGTPCPVRKESHDVLRDIRGAVARPDSSERKAWQIKVLVVGI